MRIYNPRKGVIEKRKESQRKRIIFTKETLSCGGEKNLKRGGLSGKNHYLTPKDSYNVRNGQAGLMDKSPLGKGWTEINPELP